MSKFLADKRNAREAATAVWNAIKVLVDAGKVARIKVDECETTRSRLQNDKLQALCGEVAAQVKWYGVKLSQDDWRHMFVASYRKGQRSVPGIDGGFVVLGASSKDLKVAECADVIELIMAFGAEHDVRFSQ